MNEIRKFCDERKISQAMEDAFIVYCRSDYAARYLINKDGDTIQQVMQKLTPEQVLDAWSKFIVEMKGHITGN